jgi:di/tricarboxylate transporter
LLALLVVSIAGLVPASEAFVGFGHPAVITVAAVLVVSRGLLNSGLVDQIAKWLGRVGKRPFIQIPALTLIVALCSGFMNNVGALALLMPVGLRLARKGGYAPSLILMPLAFGSLLGGMVTLIGTPPNVIIATFRGELGAGAFRMFDFAPVGAGVSLAGVVFLSLVGWRLLPERKGGAGTDEMFAMEDYLTELVVPEGSTLVGKLLGDLGSISETEASVVALVRGERRHAAPSPYEVVTEGDILVVEADSEELTTVMDATGLEMVGSEEGPRKVGQEELGSEEVSVKEAVVNPGGLIEGRTARSLNLRQRYGVNLLGVARHGARVPQRLTQLRFRAGDVLLLQGREDAVQEAMPILGVLPLAERALRIGKPRRILLAVSVFAVALVLAATGVLAVQVAFIAAAVTSVLVGLVSLRELYTAIDWPIIVLLGAMIPVGRALETTGAAQLGADGVLALAGGLPPIASLAIVLVGVMFLSDVVNNAAAAVLMAPVAIAIARGLGVSSDPFLMAVAVGASCAFLTPVGHQSNTLVMGPGGYRFGDYWRMGLPLEIIVVALAVPLIALFWPF